MINLGLLLHEPGDLTKAETWWRRAADDGDTNVMTVLGRTLQQRGDLNNADSEP